MTVADAVRQAIAVEGGRDLNPRDASGWLSPSNPGWAGLLEAGYIDAAGFSPTCTTQQAQHVNLFQTVSGFALGTASAGVGILGGAHVIAAAAIPVVGGIIAGAAAVIGIVNTILAHHQAAARQEQALGCAAIAAFDNSYTLIDQAVQNQQMTPEAAIAGLDQLYSQVSAFLAPSDSHSPYCSAVCELLIQMDVMVIYQKSRYAAMASPVSTANPLSLFNPQGTSPAATGTPTSSQPAGAPAGFAIGGSTLMWILIAIVLIFLLRG